MKNLVLGALLVAAGMTLNAHAALSAPLWGCKLKANLAETRSSLELIVVRGENAAGQGTVVCMDALGHKSKQAVDIEIRSVGVGPAFNGPLEGLTIYAARAGVSTNDGMSGEYQLQAGPRLGLISARTGLLGGVQIAGNSIGAGVEAVIENRFSVGIDVGGMVMRVTPVATLR
jgi:hypothetical protein